MATDSVLGSFVESDHLLQKKQCSDSLGFDVEEKTKEKDEDEKEDSDFSFFKAPRQKKLLLLALGIVNFCAMACFSLLSPFYPKEAKAKGVSETVVGLVFGSFEFVIFLTAPINGSIISKVGSKFMFLSGIFVCGTCTIIFGFLDKSPPNTIFIVLCFVTRGIEALGASGYVTASFAIISFAFPKHVSTVIGILETFSGVGMMVGPALGSSLYVAGGFGLPFFVLGGVLLLCGGVCYFLMPVIEDSKMKSKKSVFTLLKSPLCVVTCIITVFGCYGLGFIEPILAERLEELDMSTLLIGVLFLINSATYALGAPLWGYIGDTKGIVKPLLIFGNLSTGLTYFMLGPSPFISFYPFEAWSQVLGLVLMGLFCGAAIIPTYNTLFEGASKQLGMDDDFDTHGLISGLYNSCWSLGSFLGPMTSGYLVQTFGYPWALTVCGGIFILAGCIMLIYVLLAKFTSVCPVYVTKNGYEHLNGEKCAESKNI